MPRIDPYHGDLEDVPQVNISRVLAHLRQNAPLSRTSLAALTGLNKATISRIVHELILSGLVREVGISSSRAGRPSIMLELDPSGGYIIGASIEVGTCSVILANFAAEILWRRDHFCSNIQKEEHLLSCVIDLIEEAADFARTSFFPVLGLGFSAPGLVSADTGSLVFAPNLGWRNVPLLQILQDKFSFPIYVDNQANMAALGESYFGSARDSEHAIYIDIASGVGGGIVLNQRVLTGVAGFAGEVGHMTIDPRGPACNCGNRGCWESYVNLAAILRRAHAEGPADQALESLIEDARRGSPQALDVLAETGYYIGLGLANLINTFNPSLVVLGGYLEEAYDFMMPEINRVVRERALRWPREAAQIVTATFGRDACLMGAIATVYDHANRSPVRTVRSV